MLLGFEDEDSQNNYISINIINGLSYFVLF